MARCINVWPCFVDLGVDSKCSSIDRLFTDDYFAVFILHSNTRLSEIIHKASDLEVLAQGTGKQA